MLLFGLLVFFWFFRLKNFEPFFFFPLLVSCDFRIDFSLGQFYFFLLFELLVITFQVVKVSDKLIDEFNFSQVLSEFFFFLSFLISFFILSFFGFSFFFLDFSSFDSFLPFDEVNQLFLFPVFSSLNLVISASKLSSLAFFFYFQASYSLSWRYFSSVFYDFSAVSSVLIWVMLWFFLSNYSLMEVNSFSMGSFSFLIF